MTNSLEQLKLEFEKFDQLDLIAILSGLQVCPENQAQTIRLETATRIACLIKDGGNKKLDFEHLQKLLNLFLPANGYFGMMEDPLENLFTENIIFVGGNYIIYSGNNTSDTYILQALFHSIFQSRGGLYRNYIEIVLKYSLALLTLSNEVASRLGHHRNMVSPDRSGENILIPREDKINKICNSVIFTKDEINSLLEDLGLDYTILNQFITTIGDPDLKAQEIDKNPLILKPFVEIDDKIILVLPGSVTTALRHYILIKAEEYNAREVLIKKYRESLWQYVNERLFLMGLQPIELDLPNWNNELPIKEGTFQIDTDKIAYIQLIVDNAKDYNEQEIDGICDWDNIIPNLEKRREDIVKWLTKGDIMTPCRSPCAKVFLIIILGSIGRTILFGSKKIIDKSRTLIISPDDLDLIIRNDLDNLTLWKYAGATQKLLESQTLLRFSFIDGFAFYLDHRQSFYFDDNRPSNIIYISSGSGRSLRIKTKRDWDVHAVRYGNPPSYISVFRRFLDESIPIYKLEKAMANFWEHLVEGYAQPIWISPEFTDIDILLRHKKIFLEITDMFSYWIWQLTPELRKHLEILGPNPTHIKYNLEDFISWSDLTRLEGAENLNINFKYKFDNRTIIFTLPKNIQFELLKEDNRGERLIIKELMRAFREFLNELNLDNDLNNVEIDRILNKIAPLGKKKKLFLLTMKNNLSLYPKNLPMLRLIPEHDLEEQLDNLVNELGIDIPQNIKIIKKEDHTKICGKIVDIYLERLKAMISKFNWKNLLERLIGENEAVWYHRAFKRLTTPTSIACYWDNKSFLEKELTKFPRYENTALSTRVLIEIITAEPSKGEVLVSNDDLDKLLAMTYHLINWATLSDQTHLEIFDHEISILPSGRIGVKKEIIEQFTTNFLGSKILENIEDAINGFESHYESNYDSSDFNRNEYERVYNAEFGFTFTQISSFLAHLIDLGFGQDTYAPNLRLSELKNKLGSILNWSNTEIENIINLFSLGPREKWELAPEGFNPREDIWPWRYNRRLSYMRKPLIIAPEPIQDPLVFWGPRHLFKSSQYLFNLISTGRYKNPSSQEMKEFKGKILEKIGKKFVNEVKEWFDKNSDWHIELQVPIKPGKPLNSDIDLGDIDVLVIDKENNRLFSIECKNISFGRNPREIANELDEFFGKKPENASWIKKHLDRDKWLRNNIALLTSLYDLNPKLLTINSCFLTVEEIPSTYIKKMPLPFIAFTLLKREGLKTMNDLDDK